MSAATYRTAVGRYREALDVLGAYRGPCEVCGHTADARHRVADAVTGALIAGEGPDVVARDYLPGDLREAAEAAYVVALACLAADPRLHRVTRLQAMEIDREVWGT